jgi:hypothetical protein
MTAAAPKRPPHHTRTPGPGHGADVADHAGLRLALFRLSACRCALGLCVLQVEAQAKLVLVRGTGTGPPHALARSESANCCGTATFISDDDSARRQSEACGFSQG